MDIVKTNWTPMIDLWTLLISLRSLLTDPNPTTFANQYAHSLYFKDKSQFNSNVKLFIENYVPEDPNYEYEEDEDDDEG
jgi:ubiquitin-conjugating enzyme E2 A